MYIEERRDCVNKALITRYMRKRTGNEGTVQKER